MKTYCFRVVVEPDGDRWHAHCPALAEFGAATWGDSEKEALKHIQEVVELVVEELVEEGRTLPNQPERDVRVSLDPQAVVSV